MHVLITGASGLIGSALAESLTTDGHTVSRAVRGRSADRPGEVAWDPAAGVIAADALEGVDAVVNLSGASIGGRRWSPKYKKTLWNSRIDSTRLLSSAIANATNRPLVLVNASAVGYYGDSGDEVLTEDSPKGEGFLSDLVAAWESATLEAAAAGVRVVNTRTGLVMSSDGGILKQLMIPFKLGLGGPIGSGRRWWSPISITDEVRAIRWCLANESIAGPVNLAGPEPVQQRTFAKIFGRLIHRPAFIPLPEFALKLAFGSEMATEVIMSGQRAVPKKLLESGFEFTHPTTAAAIESALN